MRTEQDDLGKGTSMARTVLAIVLVVILVGAAVMVYRGQVTNPVPSPQAEVESEMGDTGAESAAMPEILLDLDGSANGRPKLDVDRAAAAFAEARTRYATAQSAVAEAQAHIAESERDLEELERFVEELEARGEDPAEHAEEGMKRFNPAFDAYESASSELDRAEAEVEVERVKLLGAEQELKAARRRAGLD